MKYIVLAITNLLYVLAGAAIAFGLTQLGRVAWQLTAYEFVLAEPVDEGNMPRWSEWDVCWDRYEYQVDGVTYRGPGACQPWNHTAQIHVDDRARLRVLYKRSDPAVSVIDNISPTIKSGIFWFALGGVLGWWASTWRSRSVVIHGRASLIRRLGSGAWGLVALLGISTAIARDVAEVREDFCVRRMDTVSASIYDFARDREMRMPSERLRDFEEHFGSKAVLTGSPGCLAATDAYKLPIDCSEEFHVTTDVDLGSPVCELNARQRYKVDIGFRTDWRFQAVTVRYIKAPS